MADTLAAIPGKKAEWVAMQDGWRKRFAFASPTVNASPGTKSESAASVGSELVHVGLDR